MDTLTKGELYCNFKWLHKLVRFSETITTDDNINVKLILLSRHRGFRIDLRTSKTKFKKISAEELNEREDFSLNLCEERMVMKNTSLNINHHVLFINYRIKALDVIKYMNIMLEKILDYYYPEFPKEVENHQPNKRIREMLKVKWALDLSNSLDEEYMESQYESEEVN